VQGFRDHERRARADDSDGFVEDDLDVTRIASGGELDGLRRRDDVVEPDDPAFRFRHHLLGDHDDVTVLEPTRTAGGVGQQSREIVTRLDLRDPREAEDADLVGQRSPVTRSPAWAL
jgi:hypothetical protein